MSNNSNINLDSHLRVKEENVGNYNRGGRGGSSGGGRRYSDRGRGDRQMHDAVCSKCGKDCKVPFRPTGDKPVFCSDCFEGSDNRSGDRRSPRRDGRPQSKPAQDYKKELAALEKKLDTVLDVVLNIKKTLNKPIITAVEEE